MSRQYRVAAAASGLRWFRSAIGMLDKNPRGLLLTALVLAVIQQLPGWLSTVPVLAAIAMLASLLFGPALHGGLMHAIAEADAGRPVSPMQLFEGFRRRGALMPLLVLGLLMLMGFSLLGYAWHSILGAENIAILQKIAAQQLTPQNAPIEQLAPPLMRFLLVAAVVLFVLLAGMFFAVPRVLFDRRRPLAAFVESIVACAANVLSLTVYGLVAIAAVFVLVLVFGVLTLLLGVLGKLGAALGMLVYLGVLMLALLVSAAGNYLAWREVFGHADIETTAPPTTGIAV